MKKTLFFMLFIYAFSGFSQEKVLLKGQLIFLSMNTTPVNIVNVSKHTGTINNTKGEFEIEVELGDELRFTSVQYEPHSVHITKAIFDKRWIQIELSPMVNELEEVVISSIGLTGNLKTDMGAVAMEKYYNNESFGFPMAAPKLSVADRRLYTASSGGPVGLLVNVISGRMKLLKKLKEQAELAQLIGKASQTLGKDFFVTNCGIPEEYIASFMYFCEEDPNFENLIRKNEKLVLMEFFENKAVLYKERRGWKESKID